MRVGFGVSALHLGALWALAFVQPLFDLLGDNAEFFVARGSTRSDILIFAFAYALVPPLVAAALVWAVARVQPALGSGLHVALVGLLVAAIVLPPLGRALAGSVMAVVVAIAVGAGFAVVYTRIEGARLLLTVLSPAPLISIALLLVFSSTSKLVMPQAPVVSPAAASFRSPTPIVHVILDELPVTTLSDGNGKLDAKRFPNLARLAREATWYRNATSVADLTTEAVPAQLTGERPEPGDLPIAQDYPGSLFTLFARSHDLIVEEPITDVCPSRLCKEDVPPVGERLRALAADLWIVARHLLLPADLRRGLPAIDQNWDGFGAKDEQEEPSPEDSVKRDGKKRGPIGVLLRRSPAVLGWARVTAAVDRARTRPPLIFMHSTLPHASWRYLPDGRRYRLHRERYPGGGRAWPGRQWVVDRSFQRHVLQTQFTDALVGRLFDRLRARGLYDKAVIVVTADHGASFRAGQLRRRPTKSNMADIASVPFIVKWPGQRKARIDDRAVRTIDVLPTIAKAAGVRVPWKVDGMPAAERREAPSTRVDVLNSKSGTTTTLPLRAVIGQRRAREAYETRLLRNGVYRIGPRPDLIGTQVAPDAARSSRVHATVDEPGAFSAVSQRGVLPAFVSGTVSGAPVDAVLAVAVNGRIEQTTRAEPVAGRLEYEALVPPLSLRPGSNVVDVLQVLPGDRFVEIGGTRGDDPP